MTNDDTCKSCVSVELASTIGELVGHREWHAARLLLRQHLGTVDPEGWRTVGDRMQMDRCARVLTALEVVQHLADSEARAAADFGSRAPTPARQRLVVNAIRRAQVSQRRWELELVRSLEELLEALDRLGGAS